VIIAIDGPAGSGKSTTSRAVAGRLGFVYLDTGAMYRAIALLFIRSGEAPTADAARRVLAGIVVDMETGEDGTVVRVGGEDVTGSLRSPEVTRMSSRVSAIAAVRRFLVSEQRRIVDRQADRGGGVVVEGRDIGTVVFPEAELKIFLTATAEVRAGRRASEMAASGLDADERTVREEMQRRDRDDTTREVSPLAPAADAHVVDTSAMSFDEQVNLIVRLARERSG